MDPLQIWVRNMDRKKEIRAKILKMRQALPKEEVREKSLRIMRRIEETETFTNADNLLAYIDFRGEVATGTLIEKAWELGKKVYVPRVAGKEMEFYRIHSFEDLEKGPRIRVALLQMLQLRWQNLVDIPLLSGRQERICMESF